MFAHLALASVAVVDPLEEAFLVDELDAAAAGAGVPKGVVRVAGVAADPADVFFFLLLLIIVGDRRWRRRRWRRR